MVADGYKTYTAAGLAFMAALYYILVANELDKGYELFIAALGLVGLRNAIDKK